MPFDTIFTASAAASPSTFTATVFPPDPFVGEAVQVVLDGDGGHVGAVNLARDIWLSTDVDEAGRVLWSGATEDPEMALGRVWNHAYKSDGNKSPVVSSYTFGGGIKEQTLSINVTALDDANFDKVYYLDMTGSSAGMPAEDAKISHILSEAAFYARSNADATTDRVLYRWHGGVTHNLDMYSSGPWRHRAEVTMWATYGTGRANIVDTSVFTSTSDTVFRAVIPSADAAGRRFGIYQLDIKGGWNSLSGVWSGETLTFYSTSNYSLPAVSFVECDVTGFAMNFECSGSDYDYYFAAFDCKTSEGYQDYFAWLGKVKTSSFRCNNIKQSLFSTSGLNKNYGQQLDWANHAVWRVVSYERFGAVQNNGLTDLGWSVIGGYTDWGAPQAWGRIYNSGDHPIGGYACILGNVIQGPFLLDVGRNSAGPTVTNPANVVVFGNRFYGSWYNSSFVRSWVGGVHILSNFLYMPSLSIIHSNAAILSQGGYTAGGAMSAAAWEEQNTIKFNTVVTHETLGGNFEPYTANAATYWSGVDDAQGASADIASNIISAPNAANAGSHTAIAALASGDGFKAITGGAAAITTSAGIAADIDLNRRFDPTQIGAYGGNVADTQKAAPVNSVAPTIIQLNEPLRPNLAVISDLGTWSDLAEYEEHMFLVQWRVGGVDVAGTDGQKRSFEYTPGDQVSAQISYTNIGGGQGVAISNTLTT